MSLLKGRKAERQAEKFLEERELIFITRNFYSKFGEIDLVMLDKSEIVFIEVRARKNKAHGSAAESIDSIKQNKICQSAKFFLLENKKFQNYNCRFDVVELNNFGKPNSNIEWIKDAFWLNDSFSIL